MEVLLIGLGIAAKGQQFVCGDTSCGSGVTQTCCPCQFFHRSAAISATLPKIDISRCLRSAMDSFTISNGPDGML